MKNLLSLFVICFMLLQACGEKAKEMKDAMELVQKAPEIAKNIEKTTSAADAKRAERAKRGDTLAINYEKLQQYLPTSINGYKAQDLEGESINMQGFSYSVASRRYVQESSDGNDKYVEVNLIDYNQTYALFTAATFWLTGYSREDAKSFDKTFDPGVPNSGALEHFDKVNKQAELTYGLGYRFILTIKANNQQNTDFVKSIAKSMKLSELSNM